MSAKSNSVRVERLESRCLLTTATPLFPSSPYAGTASTPVSFAGSIWFKAGRPDYPGLSRSDGTLAGTVSTAATFPTLQTADWGPYTGPVVAGSKMFLLVGRSDGNYDLNVTDGTPGGTRLINTSAKVFQNGSNGWATARGDKIYFTAGDGSGQWRLWVSDGTDSGTKPISPAVPNLAAVYLAGFNGSDVYYAQYSAISGFSLIRLSGTTATTLATTSASELQPLNATQSIFVGSSNNGPRVWVTDGTPAGTRPLDTPIRYGGGLSVLNNVAYFVAQETNGGGGLYRTDGTRAGTYAIQGPGPASTYTVSGANAEYFAGKLYITADGVTVINPDGTFNTLGNPGGNGDFYIEGDRLWLNSLNKYVTLDQPLTVRGTDAPYGAAAITSANGRFMFFGPLSGSSTQLYTWDENSVQTGSITGYLTSDLNANAIADSGEPKLGGTDVYIDLNSNGGYDAGIDTKFTTNVNGFFEFYNVPVGTWTVAPVPVAGSLAPSGMQTVMITPGFSVANLAVLASSRARLSGRVFNDVNLNGQQDTGEAGLSGVKVFISADPNATQPAASDPFVFTDSTGLYLFSNADALHGYVCVQPPSDRHGVSPTNFSLDANIPPGTVGLIAGPTVPVKVPNSVRVSFNFDTNADGVVDSSDATNGNFQLLFHTDLDQDGVVDANEPLTFTLNTGLVSNLPSGVQKLRVLPPDGWTTSLPDNVLTVDVRSGPIVTLPTFTLSPVAVANPSLSGTLTNDLDFTGTPTAGDTPVVLSALWDDADGDKVRDTNEAYTYTTGTGAYAFASLSAGSHRIALGNERQTLANGAAFFTATIAEVPPTQNLSLYPNSTATRITGTAYFDTNGNNALDAGDAPLRGIGIVNSGSSVWSDTVLTDAAGRFTAYGTAGTQRPQLRTTSGYAQVNTITPVTLTAGGTYDGFALLIKSTTTTVPPLGNISGAVYNDANFNGVRDSGETPLPGTRITLDLNLDGTITFNDPAVIAAADGTYALPAVRQGLYNLIFTYSDPNFVSTTSNSTTVQVSLDAADKIVNAGAALGAPIGGSVRDDHNHNGVVDPFDNYVQNIRVWADVDNDGQFNAAIDPYTFTNAGGDYLLTRVSPARSVTVHADAVGATALPYSAVTVAPASTPGMTRLLPTMLVTTNTAVVAGRAYNDRNRNGVLNTNELQSNLTLTLRNATTNAIVATQTTNASNYFATFNNVAPGTYRLAYEGTGVTLLENAGGVLITVGAGEVSSSSLFGYANYAANFKGRVLNDAAHDGANANDVPIAGVRAFIDLNANGIFDAGEFNGITGSDGVFLITGVFNEDLWTYGGNLIIENPSGTLLLDPYRQPYYATGNGNAVVDVGDFVYATPVGTYAAGYVYEDRNTNGVRDAGEPGLRNVQVGSNFTSYNFDAIVTDREGYYVYRPVSFPTTNLSIRTNLDNNWLSTDVPYGASKPLSFPNGKAVVDFGFVSWRLGGYAFTDANGNGLLDAGESPIAGKRVWIDSNFNNAFDTGEPTATSAADGFWSFTKVGGGSYHLMQDGAAGFVTASRDVNLGETQARGGLDLASRPANVPQTGGQTAITQISVDDGSVQRSMIRSIRLTLSGSITPAGISAGAFSLVQNSGVMKPYSLTVQSVTPGAGGSVLTLVPTGAGIVAGSIADGRYTLTIDGSKIVDTAGRQVDAAATGLNGSLKIVKFTRLRSDSDGSGSVDFNDFLALQNAFNSTVGETNYRPGIDTDANGVIDFNDFLNLQNDFGRTV